MSELCCIEMRRRTARASWRMAHLLLLLCFLSLVDLGFTLWAQRFTPFIELNPLAGRLLRHNAVASLICMKVLLTACGAGIFWRLRHRFIARLAVWSLLVVYLSLTIRWSHYTDQFAAANLTRSEMATCIDGLR